MADELHDRKMRFAALLQRETRDKRSAVATIVAKAVLGKDAELYPMYAIKISEEWLFDADVIAELDRLDALPVPKEVVMRDVYGIATNKYEQIKDRRPYYELYCQLNGWIVKTPPKDNGTGTNDKLTELQKACLNFVDTTSDT